MCLVCNCTDRDWYRANRQSGTHKGKSWREGGYSPPAATPNIFWKANVSTFILCAISCAGLYTCLSAMRGIPLFRAQLKIVYCQHEKSGYIAQQLFRLWPAFSPVGSEWVIFHAIDQIMHEAIHFVALSVEVKNALTFPYVLMTGCLVKLKYFCSCSSPSSTTLYCGPGLPIQSSSIL